MKHWQKETPTSIDVLRHGACQGGEIFRGSTDVELSELGWQQMQAAVKSRSWDQIVSSPLKRCRLFAQELADQLNLPLVVDERWREFNFGIWEGRLREEVWKESGEEVRQFFTDPTSFTPENGDTYASVCDRVDQAWCEMTEKYAQQKILLVTHGGIFRTLHAQLKSMPSWAFNSIEIPYACLSRWKIYGDAKQSRPMLSFHNYPYENSPGHQD